MKKPERRTDKKSDDRKEKRTDKKFSDRPNRKFDKKPEDRPYQRSEKKFKEKPEKKFERSSDRSFNKDKRERKPFERPQRYSQEVEDARYDRKTRNSKEVLGLKDFKKRRPDSDDSDEKIRLNRYISNSGVCSRRDADKLIEKGEIKVNGKVATELGMKVSKKDTVEYKGKQLNPEKLLYILLNKPRNCITTMDDPEGRPTVHDIIKYACSERVYPVGRLDRNTTGVLMLSNDGELSKKLTHPSSEIKKIYEATLDKPLSATDMESLEKGVELKDGFFCPDAVAYVFSDDKRIIGIELHSGRNRIVRRLFEHLGYEVRKLDRVTFAGLTKKELTKGKWRFLSEKEVNFLKMSV